MFSEDVFKKVTKRIDSYRREMIDLQIALTAINAVGPDNGGPGEMDKARFLEERLRELGFDNFRHFDAPDKNVPAGIRPNFITTIEGKNKKRFVWILTHLDVVPPGELKLWSRDPYEAYVKNGRIYGRGTEDNQQDMVASIFAAKALMDEQIIPPHSIGLAFVSDEETSSKYGLAHMLKCPQQPFGKKDLIIVPDGGNPQGTLIEVAEKSMLWLRFKTKGKQCHASVPQLGKNAFAAASYLVTRLESLKLRFPKSDKLYKPPMSTFEPTKKEPNVGNVNTIPGEDVFYLDCRVLPQYKLTDVLAQTRKIARNVEQKFKVKIEISIVQRLQAPKPTSANAPVVYALRQAVEKVYKVKGAAGGVGGGTVAAFFRKKNYPAAVWSKFNITAHQPDENCAIANMLGNAKVFAHIFLQE
ncbi:MAG TPA: M20 family metallo-hydrolase [Smithellaceae bacterium]|nr:M20 family metallo-hydrolase [Smithellaceae bacterium]HRS89173.1 M20 family metallo-hydrolase [Smithellaceae bacterium]HRV26097.1 M20 family metallo-hydrolase [Smithellaceae bacterium]